MNWIGHPWNGSVADRLGWTLLHSLWQGALVALLFAGLRSLTRWRSSNARYVLACAMLCLISAAPIFTFFDLGHEFVKTPGSDSRAASLLAAHLPALPRSASSFESGTFWHFAEWTRLLDPILPWLVVAWITGILVLSSRWVQAYCRVQRLRSAHVASLDGPWLDLLEDLKRRFHLSRPVRLLSSTLAQVPMVIGWLRPVILLPASSLTGLTPAQLEAILAHELAHVRRCDYLVNAFQNVVETVLFYHPAVWWISRCIRQERENCCDDMVVRVCQDRLVYARALFRLEELRGTPARLAFAASGGSLLQRIRRLVAPAKAPGPITAREIAGLVLAGIGCVLLALGVSLLLGPEAYSSAARIRIERGSAPLPVLQGQETGSSYDPYFIQTEFEVIQSEVILGKVIEDLNLDKAWSRKFGRTLKLPEALEILKRQIDLRPVRNTSVVEIRVYDADATQAAKIADRIAETYKDFRRDEDAGRSGDHFDSLLAQLKEEDAAIAGAQQRLDQLHLEMRHREQPSGDASSPLSAETLRKIEGLRIESQAEYVRSKVLLDNLKALKPDQLAEAIPTTGVQDTLLSQLLVQMTLAKQRLAALNIDYGPEHAEVRRTSSEIAALQEKITERTKGFLLGLAARADSLAEGLNDLSNQVARATQSDILQANGNNTFEQAKAERDLEERVRFRQMLYLKISSEKTEAQTPKHSPVQIVDRAFPASRLSIPNRPRAIAIMAAGALLAVFGLLLARTGQAGLSEPSP